jgi:uncharacterized DUF497 family protein
MTFEWDPVKALGNLRKHHVAFQEAATVFLDPLSVTYSDPDHSSEENREITIGYTIMSKRVVLVSHFAWREDSYHQRACCNCDRAKTI